MVTFSIQANESNINLDKTPKIVKIKKLDQLVQVVHSVLLCLRL